MQQIMLFLFINFCATFESYFDHCTVIGSLCYIERRTGLHEDRILCDIRVKYNIKGFEFKTKSIVAILLFLHLSCVSHDNVCRW